MTEQQGLVVSIFNGVDQAAMLDRLADSPFDDAEVGFLSDRDASGRREVSSSLLVGIRLFSGSELTADEDSVADTDADAGNPHQEAESPDRSRAGAESRASFILYGPSGPTARSA